MAVKISASLVRFTIETPLVSQSTMNITPTKLADFHDGDDDQKYLTIMDKLLAKSWVNRGSITGQARVSICLPPTHRLQDTNSFPTKAKRVLFPRS